MTCQGFSFDIPNSRPVHKISLSGAVETLLGTVSNYSPNPYVSATSIKTLAFFTQGVYVDTSFKDITSLPWPGMTCTLGSALASPLIINLIPGTSWSGPDYPFINTINYTTPALLNNSCSFIYLFTLTWNNGVNIGLQVFDPNPSPSLVYQANFSAVKSNISSTEEFQALTDWNFGLLSTSSTVINYGYTIVGITTTPPSH